MAMGKEIDRKKKATVSLRRHPEKPKRR